MASPMTILRDLNIATFSIKDKYNCAIDSACSGGS